MKTHRLLFITGIIALLSTPLLAQPTYQTSSKSRIAPLNLDLSYQKTTNLIFPYSIKSVDRGSNEVLVQKAQGVENILQLKAATEDFAETNLTIITADGSLYSFLLGYAHEPTTLNLELAEKAMATEPVALFTSTTDNEAKIFDAAEKIAVKKRTINSKRDKRFKMALRLNGIYIVDDVLYCQLELENSSNINYDIEQLNFFIRDKKKAKRTASQEIEQAPLHISGNTTIVRGQSNQTVVIALKKFTMPDKKELIIQLMEKCGGRHLQLKLDNKVIVGASLL